MAVKKRIGIFLYSMAAGGAERVVSVLLPELARRYEVTLFLMNETLFYPVPDEVEIVWLERSRPDEAGWRKLFKLPWLAWRYRRLLESYKIELSLSLMNRPNYINVLAKMIGTSCKVVISERTAPLEIYGGSHMKNRISRWLIRRLYPRADSVVVNAYGIFEDLKKNFAIPEKNITIIPNPINLETIPYPKHQTNKNNDPFVFLAVGRLERQKNHALLIKALAQSKHQNTVLSIYGEGPLRPELEALIARCGLKDRVHLAGRTDEIFYKMQSADCLLLGSDFEGFPNVLVEALACGLPVISTDCISGPREILAEEKEYDTPTRHFRIVQYGILVEKNNTDAMSAAMDEVYRNKTLREHLKKLGPKRAKAFAHRNIAKQFICVIEGTLNHEA